MPLLLWLMFWVPTSSPQMTRMFGFFACAEASGTPSAVNVSASAAAPTLCVQRRNGFGFFMICLDRYFSAFDFVRAPADSTLEIQFTRRDAVHLHQSKCPARLCLSIRSLAENRKRALLFLLDLISRSVSSNIVGVFFIGSLVGWFRP